MKETRGKEKNEEEDITIKSIGHLHTRVYIKRKSQSCFSEIYGLFSKLPIMYKEKLWKGLIYII